MNAHELIEAQALLENRIEDFNRRFANLSDEQRQYILANDPSGNQKYLLSAGRLLTDNPTLSPASLMDMIKRFHDKVQGVDLGTLTLPQLQAAIAKKTRKEQKDEYADQAELIYDDDTWKIVAPTTHEASCHYGWGTKWCTTMSSDSYWNEYYHQEGASLVYCLNRKTDEKYAIKVTTSGYWEVYDARDHHIDSKHLEEILGEEIMEKINDYIGSDSYNDRTSEYGEKKAWDEFEENGPSKLAGQLGEFYGANEKDILAYMTSLGEAGTEFWKDLWSMTIHHFGYDQAGDLGSDIDTFYSQLDHEDNREKIVAVLNKMVTDVTPIDGMLQMLQQGVRDYDALAKAFDLREELDDALTNYNARLNPRVHDEYNYTKGTRTRYLQPELDGGNPREWPRGKGMPNESFRPQSVDQIVTLLHASGHGQLAAAIKAAQVQFAQARPGRHSYEGMTAQEIVNALMESSRPNLGVVDRQLARLAKRHAQWLQARAYAMSNGTIKLDHIQVRRDAPAGAGSAYMQELGALADRYGMTLALQTATKGDLTDNGYKKTTSTGRLKKFYGRFGFKSNYGKRTYSPQLPGNMHRRPVSETMAAQLLGVDVEEDTPPVQQQQPAAPPAQAPQQPQQPAPEAPAAPQAVVTWGNLSAQLRTANAKAVAQKALSMGVKAGLGFLPGVIGQLAGLAAEVAPMIFQNDRARDPKLTALDLDDAYNVLQKEILAAFVKYVTPIVDQNAKDPKNAQKPIPNGWMNNAMKSWVNQQYGVEVRKLSTKVAPILPRIASPR